MSTSNSKDTQSTAALAPTDNPLLLPPPLRALVYAQIDPLEPFSIVDLARLCRVSKADLAIVRPILYSVVVVYDQRTDMYRMFSALHSRGTGGGTQRNATSDDTEGEDEDPDEDDYGTLGGIKRTMDERAKRMLKTLEKHPHLAVCVTKLIFYGNYETETASKIVEKFCSVCPSVTAFRGVQKDSQQEGGGWAEDGCKILDVLAKHEGQITSLAFRSMTPDNAVSLQCSLHRFPSLTSLSLSRDGEGRFFADLELWTSGFRASPPPAFALRHLDLSSVVEPALFDLFSSSSAVSLTTLVIAVRRDAFDLSPLIALQHLAIVYVGPSVVVKTLSTASPTIRSLELRWSIAISFDDGSYRKAESDYSDVGDSDEDDLDEEEREKREKAREEKRKKFETDNSFATLLSHLPSQLTSLTFSYFLADGKTLGMDLEDPNELAVVLKILPSSSFLPALERLSICDTVEDECYNPYGDDENSSINREIREKKERLEKQKVELERVCDGRGVALGQVKPWHEAERFEGFIVRAF
jgi:hypothetical protein